MCGINGIVSCSQNDLKLIHKMNSLIYHRGPDDEGIYKHYSTNFSVALGMRRLSIIDLNSGSQPIYNNDKSIVIVFNGEIYNYRILRNKLEKKGIIFKTNSDTEVILRLYENEGINSIHKLDGMYAFSIFDKKKSKIFIARDFFGEKPLYYYKKNNKLIWSSELKSIVNAIEHKPEISTDGLSLFFQLTYIPAPHTIYKDICKLEPYSYLEIDLNSKKLQKKPIPENNSNADYTNLNFKEAKKLTRSLIFESVESRAVSDVPIGSFLSGGVDSSIISLCLSMSQKKKINTFSIGFEKKEFDETDRSDEVAKIIKSDHNRIRVSQNDLSVNIHDVILNFDEPFADSSAIPTFLVSNLTSKSIKVALTGDGGDEVFGGYNKYYMARLNKIYTSIVPNNIHSKFFNSFKNLIRLKHDSRGSLYKLNRLIESIDYGNSFYSNIISLGFKYKLLKKVFQEKNNLLDVRNLTIFKKDDTLHNFRNIDKLISLEGDMLVKVDRTSMLNSLECRAPFLNKKIWDFTNNIDESFLLNKWNKKYILKESFKNYFPKGFLHKQKKGFGVPVGDWLKTILKSELLSFIEKDFVKKQGIFNYDYISIIVKNHLNSNEDNTFKVWTYYCFQKWYVKSYLN